MERRITVTESDHQVIMEFENEGGHAVKIRYEVIPDRHLNPDDSEVNEALRNLLEPEPA